MDCCGYHPKSPGGDMETLAFVLVVGVGYTGFCWLVCSIAFRKFTCEDIKQIQRYEAETWKKYGWKKPFHDVRLGVKSLCGED